MHHSTPVFPCVPVVFTGQSLISHAGVSVLTGFMNAPFGEGHRIHRRDRGRQGSRR